MLRRPRIFVGLAGTALIAALVAAAGVAGQRTSHVLLLFGTAIALTLSKAEHRP